MLLKFVELPSETFPIQSPKTTGSIIGFSKYQAIGFSSELVNGIEMSMGFDKSNSKLFIFAFIYAELVSASHQRNVVLLIRYFIITPNINLLIRDLKL